MKMLCDDSDSVVLFKLFYFNLMCIMAGQLHTLVLLMVL
jgi:hypothetical protein